MSRRIRLLLLVVMGAAALAATGLFGFYYAVQHEPQFYRKAMEIDRAALEKGSDRMLQQTAALASAVKKKGHWEALFTVEQINGWLAVDMLKNHPNTLPPELHDPRVAIGPKQITIACRCQWGGFQSVLSLTLEPYLSAPNVIAVRIVRARAGILPLPLKTVLDRLSQAAGDLRLRLQWRRAGGDPVAMVSLPPVSEDQPVQIESLRLGDGELYVAGTTQR